MLYIISAVVILIDQLSKWYIAKNLFLGETISILGDSFMLTSHRNRGAAWGMLEGKFGIFYLATIIVIGLLIYFVKKYNIKDRLSLVSIGLILGGAIGNFIDRLFRKEVVDFLEVNFKFYDTFPIFNVADMALTIGVALFIYLTIREGYLEE